jgi:hypothetical protein
MSNVTNCSGLSVVQLQIDKAGHVSKKLVEVRQQSQLRNTLLEALYPGLQVASVDVPQEPLDPYEQAIVEHALQNLECDGVRYRLIGASGSAKQGKFYAANVAYEKKLAERFRESPQAAITYFGILVSSCRVRIEDPDRTVLVVDDHELGTNDCRGWICQSLFERLQSEIRSTLLSQEKEKLLARRRDQLPPEQRDVPLNAEETAQLLRIAERNIRAKVLPPDRFYQFRLAFGKTQAKGSFKVMSDDVAENLQAHIVLPKSSVKPEYKGGVLRSFKSLLGFRQGDAYRGSIVLGIRDVSRDLEFQSSYTLVEHAPTSSLELEIKPYALSQIQKVRAAYDENNFTELFQLLGTSESLQPLDIGEEINSESTSAEHSVVEAILKADPTGYMAKHPFVNGQLQRLLAKWAFKLCTSGGFRLPGFTLADDGYLLLHEGNIISGSDWIPKDHAITSLNCRRGLVVRYPIRMKDDLLPFENVPASDSVQLLHDELRRSGCNIGERKLLDLVERQLRLGGTLVLHSQTAARNGGDFDFDPVCAVPDSQFPLFVEDRFLCNEQRTIKKTKAPKVRSPWWNLPQVAMQARGNQIGAITDLKTSCLAAGRGDLALELVKQLQDALDQLKHGTEPDQDIIKNIRQQVASAPWLRFKNKRRIDEMAEHVDVPETDRVGNLYNFVRKELGRFFSKEATLPLRDFAGLIAGQEYTREIFEECRLVSQFYGLSVGEIMSRRTKLEQAQKQAEADFEAGKSDPEARKELLFRRTQARTAVRANEERTRQDLRNVIDMVRKWALGKNGDRMAFLSALHAYASRPRRQGQEQKEWKNTGSIVFYAFPQEIVNKIVERTGGRQITVEIPDLCDGEVEIDQEGRIFLINQVADSGGIPRERHIFVAQVTPEGRLSMDLDGRGAAVVVNQFRPFHFEPGRSEVHNGQVAFPGSQQRPSVSNKGSRSANTPPQ